MKKEIKEFCSGVWSATKGASMVGAPAAACTYMWGGIKENPGWMDESTWVSAETAVISTACLGTSYALAIATVAEHRKTSLTILSTGFIAGGIIYGAGVEEYNPLLTTFSYMFRSGAPVGLAGQLIYDNATVLKNMSNQDRRLMSYGAVAALVGTLSMTPTFNDFANDVEQYYLENMTTQHIIEEPRSQPNIMPSMAAAVRG